MPSITFKEKDFMSLAMTELEVKGIDARVEGMLDWAASRTHEAEQLALDSARLLSCTGERMDRLAKQGFFKRCWSRFSGEASAMERANTADLIQMQKTSLRYINMLQEQQLMMAHSMLSLKNNLFSLAVQEEETREIVTLLAQRTLERFEKLESRVDQIEISTNLQGWLLGLEEREYDERIPTEYMRLFQVINDFYTIKNDAWNYNDLMFMRKALRTVGLNPKKKLSLNTFINSLTDEIQQEDVGFGKYEKAITRFKPQELDNYSDFVVEQISSPVFVSIHGLKIQYMDRLDVVEELSDEMNITAAEALKRLIRKSIKNLNVNLDYEFPLAETAVEILGCLRLATLLVEDGDRLEFAASVHGRANNAGHEKAEKVVSDAVPPKKGVKKSTAQQFDITKIIVSPWRGCVLPDGVTRIRDIAFFNDKWILFDDNNIYTSSDIAIWEKLDIGKISSYLYTFKEYILNDKLFIILSNNDLLSTKDGKKFDIFSLPELNNSISSKDKIFLMGTDYFIFRTYMDLYVESKAFVDKEHTFESAILMHTKDFKEFYTYNFSDDFYTYLRSSIIGGIRGCTYGNNRFIAIMKNGFQSRENMILLSENGKNWQSVRTFVGVSDIIFFNKFFIKLNDTDDKIYMSNDGVNWDIKDKTKFDINFEFVKTYLNRGIALCPFTELNGNSNSLFISNNFLIWHKIDIPFRVENRYAYNGKQILIANDSNYGRDMLMLKLCDITL
jgi:hypothetical protein